MLGNRAGAQLMKVRKLPIPAGSMQFSTSNPLIPPNFQTKNASQLKHMTSNPIQGAIHPNQVNKSGTFFRSRLSQKKNPSDVYVSIASYASSQQHGFESVNPQTCFILR